MAAAYQIIDANTTIGAHPNHRLNMSIERLISEMDTYKISASLAQSTLGIYDSYERGNTAIIEAARSNNRLVPIASINPLRYFGSIDDMRKICALGFRIFRFYPAEQGWAIESAAFANVLKQLGEMKLPFIIDASESGAPTAVTRVSSGYPAPVIIGSISLDTISESLALMADNPNIMIETHDLYIPGALETIVQKVGADRTVFGSGAPLRSTAAMLSYIVNSDLSDEDKQKTLAGNIRRVLEAK